MDIFVESCDVDARSVVGVLRAHFHEFMLGVQHELRELRLSGAEDRTTRAVARRLARDCRILALDEFQLTNISDALIVETLLSSLFDEGVLVVMTSNRPPEDLYKDGLNRHLVVPQLLALLERHHVICHELRAARDWRLRDQAATAALQEVEQRAEGPWRDFFCDGVSDAPAEQLGTLGGNHEASLKAAFADASGSECGSPAVVPIGWGRRMHVGEAANRVGRFTFPELCGAPLNADDYLKLVDSFHTFIVTDVPRFSIDQHNEARRFTNLIDCLYESHARLVVSAEAPPKELLASMEVLASLSLQGGAAGRAVAAKAGGRSSGSAAAPGRVDFDPAAALLREAVEAAAAPGASIAPGNDESATRAGVAGVMAGALGSLQESGFAARRAMSRLLHMQSEEYLQAHRRRYFSAFVSGTAAAQGAADRG